jgi:hypothetical protein
LLSSAKRGAIVSLRTGQKLPDWVREWIVAGFSVKEVRTELWMSCEAIVKGVGVSTWKR